MKQTTHNCTPEREVGRIQNADVVLGRGWFPMFGGTFKFSGPGQGFGYGIDTEFLKKLMDVFRVESLRALEGKPCWVTHCRSAIHLIEPLMSDEGKPFDIDEWADEAQARGQLLRDAGLDQYSIDKKKRETV